MQAVGRADADGVRQMEQQVMRLAREEPRCSDIGLQLLIQAEVPLAPLRLELCLSSSQLRLQEHSPWGNR